MKEDRHVGKEKIMEDLVCHAEISGIYPVCKWELLKVFKKGNVF